MKTIRFLMSLVLVCGLAYIAEAAKGKKLTLYFSWEYVYKKLYSESTKCW